MAFYRPAFDLAQLAAALRARVPRSRRVLDRHLLLAGAVCIAVAFPFTFFLTRMRRRPHVALLILVLSALSLSEVIVGFAWSVLLGRASGVSNILVWLGRDGRAPRVSAGFLAVLLGLSYIAFPFCVLTLYPPLSRLDREVTEAAQTLGASPWKTFRTVVVPIDASDRGGRVPPRVRVHARQLPDRSILGRPEHWTLSVFISDQASVQRERAVRRGDGALPDGPLAGRGRGRDAHRVPHEERGLMRVLRWTVVAFVDRRSSWRRSWWSPIVSINQNRYMDFPPEGFSFHWYAELLNDTGWRDSITGQPVHRGDEQRIAVLIATPLAYVLRAYDIRLAPVLLRARDPAVHAAAGHQRDRDCRSSGCPPGTSSRIENVIISHGIFFSTLPLVTISLAMDQMDRSLGEAAQTLGADPRTTFRTVTLPLLCRRSSPATRPRSC